MKLRSILTTHQSMIYFIVCALLPNFLFWVVSYYTHTIRSWVNLDYFVIALFFCLPSIWIRLLANILLLVDFFIDSLLIVVQLFPIKGISDSIQLLPLIGTAPIEYRLMLGLGLIWLLIIVFAMNLQRKKQNIKSKFILTLYLIFGSLIVVNSYSPKFVSSRFIGYLEGKYNNFRQDDNTNADARMFNSGHKSLSLQLLSKTNSNRILLVIDESWGSVSNPKLQDAIVQKILDKRDDFEYLERGIKKFSGVTVQAELKELCQLDLSNIDTQNISKKDLSKCLPKLLRNRGYTTYAVHGSTGTFYDRSDWYPAVGFQHLLFSENMKDKPKCSAFEGVCDSAIFPDIKKMLLANQQSFVYWMTLTTHFPYAQQDIELKRIQCEQYGLSSDSRSCRNNVLHAQFFDQLAQWLNDPALKGLEVVVIGDHQPPMFDLAAQQANYHDYTVSWLHFKLKQ